jgi:7-cyano-7-deazaguanine synthase in queuosine biosynthesis
MPNLVRAYDIITVTDATPPVLSARPDRATMHVGFGAPVGPQIWYARERVFDVLARKGLVPSQVATDFYRFAATVFSADLRIPRASGFDGWTREITLHVPVAEPDRWNAARDDLQALLEFLTGDRWEFRFRRQVVPPERPALEPEDVPARPMEADLVCLLSGGLDSALGAVDLLAKRHRVAFASHNAKGDDAFSKSAQTSIAAALGTANPNRAHHLQFHVSPPRPDHEVTGKENSQRSRSIIFFALGLLVASALPGAPPLVVPENGFISLNVPLTPGRLGTWSTRTTHPHTVATLRRVLLHLGINTLLELPYRFVTKGEMLRDSRDAALARVVADASVSCAHPASFRFEREPERRRKDWPHCGTCVPCLIRRAALARVGLSIDTYRVDVIDEPNYPFLQRKRGEDLRAFRTAVARHRAQRSRGAAALLPAILTSGPLEVTDAGDLAGLLHAYDEGLTEVGRFLDGESGWDQPSVPTSLTARP